MIEFIGQGIGIVGMILAIVSFQCRNNKIFFTMQALSGLAFAVSFFMLKQPTAAYLNLINILRGYIFGFAPKKLRTPMSVVVTALYVAATVLTYESWLSILVLAAQIVGTAAMWSDNASVIRWAQIGFVSPAWLIHNIFTVAVGGMLCEIFNLGSAAIALIRFKLHPGRDSTPAR